MAGIGFVLRKLLKKEELSSYGAAFFHSMMAASGPWILTILTLSAFFFLSQNLVSQLSYTEFRLIILFNFSVSLVFAAPVANCSTRYLADILYSKRFDLGLGLMMGMLFILFIPALPFSAGYYIFFTDMSYGEKYQAILNFMLICTIWHVSIFISTLKYYRVLTFSFLFGMGLSLLFVLKYADAASLEGMIAGFNIGLGFVLASLFALVAVEYPPQVKDLFHVISYFRRYWEIPVGFFLYAIGLWADKWIMWLSPEAIVLPNLMRMYPDYDTAMFVSYLTAIPAMALFLLIQETYFYEAYYRYFHGIQSHQNFDQIQKNHKHLTETLFTVARQLTLIQFIICVSAIAFAPYLFELIGIEFIQLSMFRIGTLGAAFQILGLFIMVFLQYFDDRKSVLALQTFFAAANILLTILTLYGGVPWYGYGFCAASILTFILAAIFLNDYVSNLEFNTFVSKNRDEFTKRPAQRLEEV
jgi:uncharacterized membrane protein